MRSVPFVRACFVRARGLLGTFFLFLILHKLIIYLFSANYPARTPTDYSTGMQWLFFAHPSGIIVAFCVPNAD
jgi:hypothetical protein